MKTLLFVFVSIALFSPAVSFGQSNEDKLTDQDWDKVIQLLMDEKWNKAEQQCQQYLKRFGKNDDSLAEPAILRYMYLRCIGAQLGEKTYSKKTALEKVKKLIGRPIITPPKEFHTDCVFNCLQLSDNKQNLSSCGSNGTNTIIQTFETYIMADPDITKHPELLENRSFRLGGIIKSIDAGGFVMPRLDVLFEDTFFWSEE